MTTYQDFLNKLQKRGSKPYKLSKCLGARDAWRWVRRNKWKLLGGKPIDKSQYSAIIDAVHKQIIELLLEGHEVEFPHQMGSLLLASLPASVSWKDGELVTNYRTDWKKTLDVWYKDEELRNTHKPIKRISRSIYFIRYYKKKARYHNRRFYKFRVNRSLAKRLGNTLNERRVETEQIDYNINI